MTTSPLPDRWATRDFPVLVETARLLDAGAPGPLQASELMDVTSFNEKDVNAAWGALIGAGYLVGGTFSTLASTEHFAEDLTERGRRAVGLWPSGDNADALVDALRQAEELVDDPEEKGLIRRAAGAVGSVSRDVMTDVLAAVIARQSGLG